MNIALRGSSPSPMQLRTLRQTFIRTITTGPVLIIAPMRTPDHSKTKLPLVESSPLVRLALLALLEVVDVRVELFDDIIAADCAREGFPELTPAEFCAFYRRQA